MAKLLKLRRGTTSNNGSFTGAEGEVTVDTDKDTLVVHDGAQAGGRALLREDMSNLPAGTIDNADVNASAAIAGTKISPDFGSQNIITTGEVRANGNLAVSNSEPSIFLTDTGQNPDYTIKNHNGVFKVISSDSGGTSKIQIHTDGHIDITGNLDCESGVDVTGNITVTGNVDGKDISALGITGTTLDNGVTATTQSASDNSTKVATTAYTDTAIANLVDSSPSALNTLNELAAALGDDANFSTTVTNSIATKMATAGGTFSGDVNFNGGAGAIGILGGGDIRMTGGTWAGDYNGGIKIQPNATDSYFQYHGVLYFRDSGGSNELQIDQSGNLTASGNVTAYSDARLKTNISTINDALGICGKLRGVSYTWLRDGANGIGVIAQEVEEVLPDIVLTNNYKDPDTGKETEIKSVDYGKIVGVLINAINELKAEVDALKGGS